MNETLKKKYLTLNEIKIKASLSLSLSHWNSVALKISGRTTFL